MTQWPFADAPNVGIFTSKRVLNGEDWIYFVSHDVDDGAWQFHGEGGPGDEEDAAIAALTTIVALDPSVRELADLPTGWCAWREGPSAPWKRKENAG